MKLSEFRFFDRDLQAVHFVDESYGRQPWEIGSEVAVVLDGELLVLSQGDCVAVCRPSSAKTLTLASSGINLWRIASNTVDHLQLEHCDVQQTFTLDFAISVDAYLVQQLVEKSLIDSSNIDVALLWLREEFVLERKQAAWLTARYFKSASKKDLQILGRRYSLSIVNENNRWVAKTFTNLRIDNFELIGITGSIQLIDGTVSAQVSTEGVDALAQHIDDSGSYLELWQTYSELQWKIASRSAKKLGLLRYSSASHKGGETPIFKLNVGDEAAKDFHRRLSEIMDEGELGNSDIIFEISAKAPEWLENYALPGPSEAIGARPLLANNIKISPPYVEFEIRQRRPPKEGFIFLSLQGDKSAHERRERAYTAIQTHQNPMPQLRHLLEGLNPPVERSRRLKALSSTARKRFKAEPTERQKEALEVALNTPDVALIIGPPGTGKTQVITALQQRIVDEYSSESLKHQILLTSFQHDAVDNVVDRSGVFGLPAMKVGGRRFGGDAGESALSKWRVGQLAKLKPALERELEEWPEFRLFDQLREVALDLRISRMPSLRNALIFEVDQLLSKLEKEHQIFLSPDLKSNWATATDAVLGDSGLILTRRQNRELTKKIRGLRVQLGAYQDDGSNRLVDLKQTLLDTPKLLEHDLVSDTFAKVESIYERPNLTDADFAELQELRDLLLDWLRPDYRPALLRGFIDESLCSMLDEIELGLSEALRKTRSLGPLMVRREYLKTLEEKPLQIEDSIRDYVTILGATCQQAAGDQMSLVKETSDRQGIAFDTVVVDEAARANPLDLMIPMAMAKRRIVLVGDHLQLPHMLEPRVEEELQDLHELDEVKSELLRTSLFENLHKKFITIQKDGGQKRVVMLDTQFRMHPELGRFVSQEFYEKRGFEPIKAGLPDNFFDHSIDKFEGAIAAWINVPKDLGTEKSRNGSKLRLAEAKRSAAEASDILNTYPAMSVGIITFYGAQRDAIYKELADLGLAEMSEDGWQVKSDYRLTSTGEERLRVGSVDAFQGKEFDVVILSVVRTWDPTTELTDESLNRKLGFLRLPNRINVGMSRQKKLLIVIGDRDLSEVTGEHPETGLPLLPGFPAFYNLCRGPHGKLL